ncbi:hypothetical protein K2173_006276 [Erythroxylum novogranatense]|uniref:Histone-lysine N-methyltransferase SUVR5 n=1 Tax=Erythroxylum novogranatense TaxID=1862640 RepID=A0AAV8TDR1_9ROSI|nr:hypothetical protein K2173_006276 [Erythroxylum novogranatense]
MEVLPCSGVQYVGESDGAQQNSGTSFAYSGESNGFEHRNEVQAADARADGLLPNMDKTERSKQGHGTLDESPMSEGHKIGAPFSDCQAASQRLSCDSYDFNGGNLNMHGYCIEPCATSENSHLTVDPFGSEPSSCKDGDSSHSEPKWLENDEAVALWAKWRGKWQAGIRCASEDRPLSTLKAKPTHDRKKYFVVFFPHTRNYSWVDMQLVQPINEFPQPIAYRNHKIGLKMVNDLSVPRRFIMQKLAVGMLNIVDQFHREALIDTARDVMVWKEFAMEASRCNGYPDLGRMLLKLQMMILQRYLNSNWLLNSFQSWVHHCQTSNCAESIELLREELFDSILWDDISSLRDPPGQPTFTSEWKTWKHEVMKWFSTSHPISSGDDMEHRSCDSPSTPSLQVSMKRPKLEVRRAEPHSSQVETSNTLQSMTVEIDSEFFNNRDSINASTLVSKLSTEVGSRLETAPAESPCSVAERWDEIVVEAGSTELMQPKHVEMTPVNGTAANKNIEYGNKNRQCTAFIESKGRQCVRWANDGDVYCCVHLASRFTGSSTKVEASPPVHTPLCEGTTVLGTRCKHRSLPGSLFCKKHRPRTEAKDILSSPEVNLKRKHEEINPSFESSHSKDVVVAGEVESPLQVEPLLIMDDVDAVNGRNSLVAKLEYPSHDYKGTEVRNCIGSSPIDGSDPCNESPKRYSIYCEKHIPSWLKRARNGKSRIISKEVFLDLLKYCSSVQQKMHLHQACELFYKLFKSILSLRNPVPMDVQLQWALNEALKDSSVGELLLKLVYTEKDRLMRIWGFSAADDVHISSSEMPESINIPLTGNASHDDETSIKCKICSKEFLNDQDLSSHWMDIHKKEAQWLFRGHACAICLDSFTNKKGLETHVQERHHVQFVEQCMLLQCIPCHSHFGNIEQLWLHVFSVHPMELRLSKPAQHPNVPIIQEKENSVPKVEQSNVTSMDNNTEHLGGIRKFVCRFCGLKFDLLPDLGRHHQAAHMGPNLSSSRPQKKGIHYYAYKLKSGRLTRPRFKKGLGAATYRIRNRGSVGIKKPIRPSKSLDTGDLSIQPQVTEFGTLGRLAEPQCAAVAKILFSEVQKSKARPNNHDILVIARSVCCKVSLKASLEGKYGVLPESLYLKAAKLCSEHNIRVQWHQEGFICPRGCKSFKDPGLLSPVMPFLNGFVQKELADITVHKDNEWSMDECHCVIDLHDLRGRPKQKATVLCDDISFGKEPIPVTCVMDEDIVDSRHPSMNGSADENPKCTMPWEMFTYVTRPLLDQLHGIDIESLNLGCSCQHTICCAETCDHVYLFENDYEDAKDINGKSMNRKFPYDDKGRIILEEGYLVYECNRLCGCNKSCPNRVLQNGIRVKLEVFKTENKGWAVRAGEPILRGTFICEYIGEVLEEQEAEKRHDRYGKEGCSYIYNVDAHTDDMSRLIEGQPPYVIDATKYGNVSRFINHSCMPNLVNRQVLVDSMDSMGAHIGLYASRDIACGEELTYNYRYELLPGEGYPCHCGASKCRGRLY